MTTITKIKKHNDEAGFTFFSKERLKLRDAKALDKVYMGNGKILFILSLRNAYQRLYNICEYDGGTGFVGTLVGTMPYSSLEMAKSFANKITHENKKRPAKKKKRATTKKKSLKSKKGVKNDERKKLSRSSNTSRGTKSKTKKS